MGKDLNRNFPKEDRWMAKDCTNRCSTSEVIHWGNAVKAIIRYNSTSRIATVKKLYNKKCW